MERRIRFFLFALVLILAISQGAILLLKFFYDWCYHKYQSRIEKNIRSRFWYKVVMFFIMSLVLIGITNLCQKVFFWFMTI
ncbi:MAG: hypothetical protein ACLU84_02525 [Clostridia bacterium]